ncbi:hypothetical protein MKY96_32875 [Paenibacillus sp. FSL R7-0302]|uniref:hypothetical protein n=1 Tax=Paenibacillus sp. FSL R7-0302 TaxID=2921681 RepID=UPI0030FD0503
MKEEFIIFVNVSYNMKTCDWVYKTYDTYPANSEVKDALEHFKEKPHPTINTPTIHHARVEKRYILN